jgi:membrane protease YdiL (CAAX protease family)
VGWYLAAVAGPFLVYLFAAMVAVATGARAPELHFLFDSLPILLTLATTILVVGVFEEVGWRGYALPRLQSQLPALAAALILGGVWALRHLPVLVSDPADQRPPLQFIVGTLAQSVILAWMYNRTNGSLLVVVICHAAVNAAARLTLTGFAGSDYHGVWWATTVLYVCIAVLVTAQSGPQRLGAKQIDPIFCKHSIVRSQHRRSERCVNRSG